MKSFPFFVFLAVGLALADSAEMWEFPDGRTVMPIPSARVRMVAETVLITPSAQPSSPDDKPWDLMDVRCVFILENITKEPLEITVGFPFESEFGDFYRTIEDEEILEMVKKEWNPGEEVEPPESLRFRAEVNGKTIPVEFKKGAANPQEKLLYWPIIATWKMRFAPGERVRLVNAYTTGWDGIGSYRGIVDSITYITRSGALWAGDIGSAVISITVPEALPLPCFSDTLCAAWDFSGLPEIRGRTLTWTYRDWEPSEDISLRIWYYNPEDAILEAYIFGEPDSLISRLDWRKDALYSSFLDVLSQADALLIPPQVSLRVLRNLPFAAHGHQFSDPFLSDIFPWGDRKVSLGDLSPQDRKRVDLARSLEEELALARRVSDSLGYTPFLPMFALKTSWSKGDLALFHGDPESESKYLFLLENLGAAVAGERFKDKGLDAFFRLTGWYIPGKASAYGKLIKPIPAREVNEYRRGLQ